METYIQIGQMATRTPGGGICPAVPIYAAATPKRQREAETEAEEKAAPLFLNQMQKLAAAYKAAGLKRRI